MTKRDVDQRNFCTNFHKYESLGVEFVGTNELN